MTWKEFKEAVEAQGVTDDDKVEYIDTYPERGISVGWDEFPAGRQFYVQDDM